MASFLYALTSSSKCLICSPCYRTTHSSWRRHRPMARSMKRYNSLPHSVTIACFIWLIVVNRRRLLKGTQNSPIDWIQVRAVLGPHVRLDERDVLTPQVRRCVPAVCDGAPSCCRHPCKLPALLLEDVTVTLDNN